MTVELIPFQPEFLAESGELLAARHRRDRAALPELPVRFEEPAACRQAVTLLWNRPLADGVAAVRDGRLVAYMIGDMVIDPLWGRTAWVRHAGCAVDPEQNIEIVQDMYARLGERWVAYGCFFHFTLIPTGDQPLVHSWFSLSFGLEQVHGVLDLTGFELPPRMTPPGIEIRRAGIDDREALLDLSDLIWRHQVRAPVWGVHLPERQSELRSGWAELVDDPAVNIWLAFYEGRAIASQGYWPVEPGEDNLLIGERCVRMSIAGTKPEFRGRGIGQALTRHGLAQARAAGYRLCETDWRSTNLAASRMWPRQGFRPAVYRLVRRIDSRIAWGNERALAARGPG